ncbi:hypothetical protein Asulf_01638 [Archaeoglobus sulfaticallidus PM70-1]|uniref:Uncharacterized protein n=1 Tax=Archaeoglobus sulfaticallidus PM70-1 TaxID=387631 RepID=N0BF15_9EURY|nr:hypothetical protein [Archaeoglobus sulfaticallidus]AGK61613.1 hypothetical protein Asulf_01638 [Archaeoglobus sulfaticallidus PM70-1]
MEFRSLIVTDQESYVYRELEEVLMSLDFEVEFTSMLSSDLSWISKSEFKYDVFFLLKEPENEEIPAVSSLSKIKVMLVKPSPDSLLKKSKKSVHWLNSKGIVMEDYFEVKGEGERLIISASSMLSKTYFKDVEKICCLNAYHLDGDGWDVVIHGDRNTKAYLEGLITKAGRDVRLAIRKDNLMVFSCDIFSNEAMKYGDNARFIENVLEIMLKGAVVLE